MQCAALGIPQPPDNLNSLFVSTQLLSPSGRTISIRFPSAVSSLRCVCVCVLALQLIYLISEQSLWTNSWEICPLAPPPATHSFSLSAPPGRPSPGLIKEASLDWEQLGSCDLPRQAARRGFFFPVSGTVKLTRIARQRGQQIQYTERIGIRAGKKRGLKVCAREKSERGDTL